MAIQEVTNKNIQDAVEKLGTIFMKDLAVIAYGSANTTTRRKISYWTSGQMVDKLERKKIYLAAQKLIRKREKQLTKLIK